ncbi:hypothetical protein FQN57_006743 [Myotisia sp. PD_48]|nr:hypothetical protein FQN57_006743 [Myotisia sp. PD_48]
MSTEQSHNLISQRSNSQIPFNSDPSSFSPASRPSHYAQRYAQNISLPVNRVTERTSREIRRGAFLKRVRRERDAGKFNARSDQIQYMDFLEDRRKFNDEMNRAAPAFENIDEEDSRWHEEQDEDRDETLLEEFIAQEKEYLEFIETIQRNEGESDWPINTDVFEEKSDDDAFLADLISQVEEPEPMDTSPV